MLPVLWGRPWPPNHLQLYMTLEKILQKFPPDEEKESWEGHLLGFEWKLNPDTLFGWKLFVTFWLKHNSFSLQGLMKGDTFEEAIRSSVDWINQFRGWLLQAHENLSPLAPPTALERVLEDD